MSVTEAESPTALEPLTSGDDTHSIVKDHAHNASISSKDTLVVSFNDTLTDGLIAKHVESLSEVLQIPEVAMHASNSKTESHVDSIVNDSILDPSSMGAISVPPGEEHQEVATQVARFEEPLQEPANPTTAQPLTTDQHGNADTEEKLIEGVNAASFEGPAPAINVASETDKESTITNSQKEVNNSKAMEETLTNVDKSTSSALDVSPAVAPPDPAALTDEGLDISSEAVSSDIATEDAPSVLENSHADSIAEHPVAQAAAIAEVLTAETKEQQDEALTTTSLTLESAGSNAAVQVSIHAAEYVEETAPTTSGGAEFSVVEETSTDPPAKEDIASTAEPTVEHVTEIHDEEASTAMHETATFIEPIVVAEVLSYTANDVQDIVQPTVMEPGEVHIEPAIVIAAPALEMESVDDATSSDVVEANGHANDLTEPEDPIPSADAPALDVDAIAISEPVAEPADVHGTDDFEPTIVIAAPTPQRESFDATSSDTVEAIGSAHYNPTVLEDPNPAVENPAPDVTVSELVVEPTEVHDTEHVEPTTIAEPIIGHESFDDATLSGAVDANGDVNENPAQPEDPSTAVDTPAPDADDLIGEPVLDPMEVHDTKHVEPTSIAEPAEESVDDSTLPNDVDVSVHTNNNPTELGASPIVDAPAPDTDDIISEPVVEPAEVHDPDHVEPTSIGEPTTEKESLDTSSDAVEAIVHANSNPTEPEVSNPTADAPDADGTIIIESVVEHAEVHVEPLSIAEPTTEEGYANNNPTELGVSPIVDAPAPDTDDTITEPVTEPTGIHDADRVEPTIASTTEIDPIGSAAPVVEIVEHASVTETITSKETAENVPIGGGVTVDSFTSDPTTAEELPAGVADEDNVAVHTHPKEAAALALNDVEPTEEPVDVAHDASPAENCEVAEAVDPVTGEISEAAKPEEDVVLSALSEAQHFVESAIMASPSVEEVKLAEVHTEEATTHVEVFDLHQEPTTVEEAVAQELGDQDSHRATSAVSEAVDNVPALEGDDHPLQQFIAGVDSHPLSEAAEPSQVNSIPEVVEEETAADITATRTSSDAQTAINERELSAEEDHPAEEQLTPADDSAVEPEVPAVIDAIEPSQETAVVEIVTTAESIHVLEETVLETVSVQEGTKSTVVAEAESPLSVEEDTPVQPSSEQAEPADIQERVHIDAEAADGGLVHEDADTAEIQEPVDVETPAVDVDSAIPADGLIKEESIHTEDEPVVEEPIAAPSMKMVVEESVETSVVEEVIEEASMEDTPVPEVSIETIPNQDTDIEANVEDPLSAQVAEDTPVVEEVSVLPVQNAPVVHDEITVEDSSPVVVPLDMEVPAPLVEVTEKLDEIGQVENMAKEDIPLGALKDDIVIAAESQQSFIEQNEIEEAAQEVSVAPVTEEEVAVPSPAESAYPDALVAASQEPHVGLGKDVDEPITSTEILTQSEYVDSTPVEDASTSEGDLLKTTEDGTERPKSPWMPSFQVTTVGRAVSASTEDEQPEQPESQGSSAVPVALSSDLVPDGALDEPRVDTPAIEAGQTLDNASRIEHVTPPLLVDTSSLDTSAEPARPWTPSYSVHSQGSPLHMPGVIEQEDSITSCEVDNPVLAVVAPELPDMKFADNEEISVSNKLGSAEPATAHYVYSVDKVTVPLADTDIQDAAVIEDVVSTADLEETIPGLEGPDERLLVPEVSVEVVTSSHADETQGVNYDLEEVPKLVLEEFTEVPAQVEGEYRAVLSTPPENLQEQSSSLSWVPSYSVSRQGSPLQRNVKLMEEESLEIPDYNDISLVKSSDDLADPHVSVEDATKVLISELQMPNEEVGNFTEPAILVEGTPHQDSTLGDANNTVEVDNPVDFKVSNLTVVIDGENRAEEASHAASIDVSADQPKSPWTPSYSVMVQGPETASDRQQVEVEPPARHDVDEAIIQDANVHRPGIPEILEPEKTATQFEEGNVGLPPMQENLSERTQQSTSFHVNAAMGSVNLALQEPFPLVENTPEQTEQTADPQVLRLEPVNETTEPDVLSAEGLSPPTRKRLESTTSSRFFPGGWFSTASKVVDEGRTSLEIAQGEFTPLKPTSPDDEVPDSPVSEDSSSIDDDDESEQKEKKGWCVVM